MNAENDKAAKIAHLREVMSSIKPGEEITLTPSVTKAIPTPTTFKEVKATLGEKARELFPNGIEDPSQVTPREIEEALAKEARNGFDEELDIQVNKNGHSELVQKTGRIRFIRNALGYGNRSIARSLGIRSALHDEPDRKLAQYLGVTINQVQREDLRGPRNHKKWEKLNIENLEDPKNLRILEKRRKWAEKEKKFEERFNGLFTLISIVDRNILTDDVFEKRATLATGNGRISDISVGMALRGGYPNIAVSLALEAARQKEEMMDIDRHPTFEA